MRRGRLVMAPAAVLLATTIAACGNPSHSGLGVPKIPMKHHIGAGEGVVNLVAWAGYVESGQDQKNVDWVHPFERRTGCQVNVKVADTSDEMVALMKSRHYDAVSASGDASLRLIRGGDVAPVNTALVPHYRDIQSNLKNQPFNSIGGRMYGIPHGYGANELMWRADKLHHAPTSWSVVWNKNSPAAGHIVDYDSPIYIADAALYLKKHRPKLKITNPYELDSKQFDAAVNLLKSQRPSMNQYWANNLDELASFKTGDNWAGTTWQVTANLARKSRVPVKTTIPSEGATGWSDTWMVSSRAAHPNCTYRWLNWISGPRVQAAVAQWFGEAPANPQACRYTGRRFCRQFHVNDKKFYRSVAFWQTPSSHCGDSRGNECVGYSKWTQAWTQIKG